MGRLVTTVWTMLLRLASAAVGAASLPLPMSLMPIISSTMSGLSEESHPAMLLLTKEVPTPLYPSWKSWFTVRQVGAGRVVDRPQRPVERLGGAPDVLEGEAALGLQVVIEPRVQPAAVTELEGDAPGRVVGAADGDGVPDRHDPVRLSGRTRGAEEEAGGGGQDGCKRAGQRTLRIRHSFDRQDAEPPPAEGRTGFEQCGHSVVTRTPGPNVYSTVPPREGKGQLIRPNRAPGNRTCTGSGFGYTFAAGPAIPPLSAGRIPPDLPRPMKKERLKCRARPTAVSRYSPSPPSVSRHTARRPGPPPSRRARPSRPPVTPPPPTSPTRRSSTPTSATPTCCRPRFPARR